MSLFACLPAIAIDREDVSLLIHQLNANTRSERVQAERQLVDLGEEILPLVKQFRKTNPELDFQLQTLQRKIQAETAARALKGTLISFPSKKPITLREAVQLIHAQSEIDVIVAPSVEEVVVQIAEEKQSFWSAIDSLSKSGDLGWLHENHSLLFSPRALLKHGAKDYPTCFRVAAVHQIPRQLFRGRNRDTLTNIGFRIDVEPHIEPFFVRIHDQDFRLTSSNQEALLPFSPDAKRVVERGANPWFEFSISFLNNNPITSEIVDVDGKGELFCSARQQLLRRSLASQSKVAEPVQSFSVQEQSDSIVVDIALLMDEGIQQLDSHQLALLHRNAWLVVENQQRIEPIRKEVLRIEGLKHSVQLTFPKPESDLDQIEFQYLYPEFLTTTSFEFSVKGIEYRRR
ncbi:hypothetical protein [Thalassoglobus polymorphus]|uniref:hypothetical protein n=1 Tax=Thalassoglobus polymorphus TaxID=2527994 RepID=UPI0011A4433B|nr:hypothetical protein [Thalassoglobus polymorphus]